MSDPVRKVIVWISPVLCALLLAGNLYFIARLVEKIEDTSREVARLSITVGRLEERVDMVRSHCHELKH
jgi:outer membrane murein-binding lipoprotein Lpp